MSLSPADLKTVDWIAQRLSRCRSILFVTGAGMSAESGIPTYRGVGGLYNAGETEEGLAIEELLSGEVFARRPEWTWKYLRQIEQTCRGATFNRGHAIIAEMERHFPQVWTLTQNVDGFHRAAGARNIITIHGNLHQIRCTKCPNRFAVADYSLLPELPRCDQCGGILRPAVVLFGEMIPEDELQELKSRLREGFDIVFSIGTTSVFPYIAFPVELALQREKPSVEINPDTTRLSELVTYRLAVGATAALEAIWANYNERRTGAAPLAD
jgi:NAD-dependent deacetylase